MWFMIRIVEAILNCGILMSFGLDCGFGRVDFLAVGCVMCLVWSFELLMF